MPRQKPGTGRREGLGWGLVFRSSPQHGTTVPISPFYPDFSLQNLKKYFYLDRTMLSCNEKNPPSSSTESGRGSSGSSDAGRMLSAADLSSAFLQASTPWHDEPSRSRSLQGEALQVCWGQGQAAAAPRQRWQEGPWAQGLRAHCSARLPWAAAGGGFPLT